MADKRITELSLHTSLTLSDIIPIVNNNETKKTTYGSLYYAIREGLVSGSSQILDYNLFATTGSNTFNGNQTINGNLNITGSFSASGLIYPTTDGTAEQFLSTDGLGNLSFENVRTLYQNIRNMETSSILKGTPLFASGSTGDNVDVYIADAGNPLRMPATLVAGDTTLAPNAAGKGIILGHIEGVDTNLYPAGTAVYVGVGGGWTATRPTGSLTPIQPLGIVTRQGNNGMGIVLTVPPTDLPNIQSGYFWVGNGTNLPTAVSTASFATTGSNTFYGNQIITGSLFVSGTTEFGGNLVPKFPSGSTLGTLERPFREIFVSSGSINVASDIPGEPNTSISNIGGNLLISAGGMRLVGDASFIAATGSFQYLSGSFTHVGSAFRTGNTTIVGNQQLTGSLTISGSGFINTHRILTDLDSGSYAVTGSNIFSGSQGISGSLYVSQSLNITNGFYVDGNKQFNYGQFSDTTIQTSSLNTAYSMKFNTTEIASGFSIVSGSRITAQHTGIYNLQFGAQLDNPSNTNEVVDIWLSVTGSNIPNSNTSVSINKAQAGNIGKLVAAWNYMIPLSASQYVELKWSSSGGNIILLATGSQSNPDRPMTPSVIATITQIA